MLHELLLSRNETLLDSAANTVPMQRGTAAASGAWIVAATVLGSSLVFIDGSVVAIALPIIQDAFHATAFDAQWVVEGYTLVLGAFMLLCGALGDRYGRKRLFIGGVVLFAVGSILCGLSNSMPALIGARMLQGAGGTMLAPASLALLGATFEGEARGKAVGTWSGWTAVAGAIGPVAGGSIVDHLGWRWIFFINVPIAIAVIAVAMFHVRESRDDDESGALDILGSIVVSLGLGAVVYGFVLSGLSGWTAAALGSLVAGIALLVGFVALETRVKNPILPLGLFKNREFSGINGMTFLLYGALSGVFYFLPFVLIQVDGYSATEAGFSMLPFLVLMVVLSRYAGALVYRVGRRTMLVAGPSITACGFALLAFMPNLHYWTGIFPAILCIGIGMGLTVAPLTTTMIDSVPEHNVGVASGVNSAVSRIAGLLAIAILGAFLATAFNAHLGKRMDAASLSSKQRSEVVAQRSALAGARLHDPQETGVVRGAYTDGFRVVALSCVLLTLGSALVAFLTLQNKRSAPDPAKGM
jgi:EmrB/QacA subfamily drug resistance transporter